MAFPPFFVQIISTFSFKERADVEGRLFQLSQSEECDKGMLKTEEVNFSAGGGAVVIPILIMQEYILDLSNHSWSIKW